jgi:hypothetical protein
MADTITILIDGKQVEIPEFAYDKTLKDLIKVVDTKLATKIEQSVKEEKKGNSVLASLAKKEEEIKAKLDKQQKLQEKKAQQDKTNNAKVADALQKSSKANGMVEKALSGIGGAGGVFPKLLGGLSSFSKFLNPVTAGLAGLAQGLVSAVKFLLRLGQLDNTLFRRGLGGITSNAGFGGGGVATGVASLATQAYDASLTLDQFAEMVQEFATTAGEFGTQTISDAIVGVQKLTREQGYLGLSNQELAAATGETADVLRQLGFNFENNGSAIAQNTVSVLQVSQAFTKVTNTSSDLIRQLTIQASQVEAFTNALRMLPSEVRQSTLQSAQMGFAGLASFGDEAGGQLTTALAEGIGRGGLQFTQFGQDLARVSPALLTGLQNIQDAAANNGDVAGALDSFRTSIADVDSSSRQFLRALEISGDPMAKFVIKLANLNETIDDVTFKQLANLRNQISPDELGKAQLQLRLAIEKVKTAFQKLLIAFITPETVKGFGRVVDNVSKYLGKLADYLKGDAFNIINGAFTKVVQFFTGMGPKLGSAISVGINRGLALALPSGTNEKDLARYDNINAMLKTNPDDPDTLKKAYAMLRRGNDDAKSTDPWAEHAYKTHGADYLKKYIQDEIGPYTFKGGGGFNMPTGGGNQVQTPKDQIFANNSRIRITPMFGGDQFLKEKKAIKQPAEYLHELSEEYKKQTVTLEKIESNTGSSAHSGKKAADSLVRTEYDQLNVSP